MFKLAKIGLAIVIVVSVASILITPDSSDDVSGVIQRIHVVKPGVVLVHAVETAASSFFTGRVVPTRRSLVRSNQLELVCTLRC